jgi:hypothetical protein
MTDELAGIRERCTKSPNEWTQAHADRVFLLAKIDELKKSKKTWATLAGKVGMENARLTAAMERDLTDWEFRLPRQDARTLAFEDVESIADPLIKRGWTGNERPAVARG